MPMEHIGYKTIGLFVGLLLGTLWVIFDVLKNWLNGFNWTSAISTLSGFAVLVLLIPLIPWIAHFLYRLIFKAEETVFGAEEK